MDYSEIKELVLSAALGEKEALETLFNSTGRRAYFIAMSASSNESSALFILYDSYFSALKNIGAVRHPERFERWINQVVANRCAGVIRDYQPDIFLDGDTSMASLWEPEDADIPAEAITFDRKAAFSSMIELIDTLPLDVRLCLVLHYYAKLTPADIAYSIGTSEAFVKDRLYRARLCVADNAERFAAMGVDFALITPMTLVTLTLMSYAREAFPAELSASVLSDIMLMLDGAPVDKLNLGKIPPKVTEIIEERKSSPAVTVAIIIAAAIIVAGTAIGISIAGRATDPLDEVTTASPANDDVEETIAPPDRVTDAPTKYYYDDNDNGNDDDDSAEEAGTTASSETTTEATTAETTTGTTNWKDSLSDKINEGLSDVSGWFTTRPPQTTGTTAPSTVTEPTVSESESAIPSEEDPVNVND